MSLFNRKNRISSNQGLMKELAENFIAEKPKRRIYGNFRIEGDRLLYRTENLGRRLYSDKDVEDAKASGLLVKEHEGRRHSYSIEEDLIAIKVNGRVIGNASILPLIGARCSYGHKSPNRGVTLIQRELEKRVCMIPFSVMAQAELDITKIKFIEEGSAESVKRDVISSSYDSRTGKNVKKKYTEQVHFTGSKLFEVDGTQFLFDLDRRELKHRIFNPFLVKLPKHAKSIAEAYELLKPRAVLQAEKSGTEVLRQGEWFFIKTKAPKLPKLTEHEKVLAILGSGSMYSRAEEFFSKQWGRKKLKAMLAEAKTVAERIVKRIVLKAGENRPNEAELGVIQNGMTYVTGKVTHSGREHADLVLKGWYIAVSNTAQKSFTITGDID